MTAAGVPFDIEFMITDPSSERFLGEYVRALDRLGIAVTQRRVDDAQYERRVKSFDFDIVGGRFTMQLTPGLELKTFFGSDAARTEGSRNLAGIRDPVVDALIDRVIEAKNRAELEAAARALDRVLRAGHHWVSHWFYPAHRLAFWDKFGWPRTQPQYTIGLVDTWWYDAQKAAKLVVN